MSGKQPLWAHSPAPTTSIWHSLDDHLRGTAELARRFAEPFGGGELAYWLGRLHDCGKAGDPWQTKLSKVAGTGKPVGIDHKSLGTRIAVERKLGGFAGCILGHHGGLIDTPTLAHALQAALGKDPANLSSAEQALPALLPDLPDDLRHVVPEGWWKDPLVGEMAMRLCYSALVDADVLDTQAHHHQLPAPRVRPDADFGELFRRFEQRRVEQLANRLSSPIDELREQVYADCLAAAAQERGIFRLHAPTGVGKTLASGGFALRHAAQHGMRRVIVAVPFLTITEQNAAVYRTLLDEDGVDPVVLEHHSQVEFGDDLAGRLAAENWDRPFVVTTFVRLFESLYARKPSAMRRVHRLAGSVIVLDEVQALPHDMLVPILDGLRLLVENFGATVLLSSATQPEFWSLQAFKDAPRAELISNVPALNEKLRRVTFDWRVEPELTLADVAAEAVGVTTTGVQPGGAAMVVVNTTANAQAVYEQWREAGLADIAYHLSTRMCPAHRRRVLAAVTSRLKAGEPVLLVSTQLIEAGVDVDFPVVFRAMAPADSLLQAAGRANREGRLDRGRVVVFKAVDAGAPPAYKKLVGVAETLFGPKEQGKADPDDVDVLSRYYRRVYGGLGLEDRQHVGQLIQQARQEWKFQTVADGPLKNHQAKERDRKLAFRMIRDEGISVVTPQGAETVEECDALVELIEKIRTDPLPDLRDLRRLQPYTTTVHPSALRNPDVKAWMRPVRDSWGGLNEWFGTYDPATGISFDPGTERFVL